MPLASQISFDITMRIDLGKAERHDRQVVAPQVHRDQRDDDADHRRDRDRRDDPAQIGQPSFSVSSADV